MAAVYGCCDASHGKVLVKVETSGLCHTDIHAAHDDWPVKPMPPFVSGHEGVGIVERVDPGATTLHEGDRVAVPWLGWACGACELCASGWETPCPSAPLHRLFGRRWVRGVRAGGGGVRRPGAGAGRPLDAAPLHLGAASTVNASTEDPTETFQRLGGADAAIVLAPAPKAFGQAFASLRPNGTLVMVGLPKGNTMRLPIFETVLRGVHVVASLVGTRVDLAETFELHADGRTHIVRDTRRLEQVNEAIAEVESGHVVARLVFDLR